MSTSVEGSETVRSSPYKGLAPYSEADAAFFFGRSAEREIVAANLMASRLTLLYGASGVGKSSLLQAGVASYLRGEPDVDRTLRRRSDLLVVFNRWTGDPVHDLIEQILQTCAKVASEDAGPVPSVARDNGAVTLADTLQRLSASLDVDFLIILDQFEEYFLYHEHEDGDGRFAVEFPRAVNRAEVPANFLIAMREDQLARLDRFKGRLPQLFDNTLRLTHLRYEAARAAILQPLDAYNRLVGAERSVAVQPELIDTILEDIQVGRVQLAERGQGGTGNAPGEPASSPNVEAPYLQLVMSTLWEEERRQGSRVLRAETLHSLGGAQRIVRTHLDDAMNSLTGQEQDIAAAVFRYLVTPSGSKISYSDHDLAAYAGLPKAVVAPVLQKLSGGEVRILRPGADHLGHSMDGRNYEIFHDVLAPAILDWRTRYAQQKAAEEELGRRLEREAEERRAVEEQARLYHRRAQRRGAFAVGMVLVLVIVVALAFVSLHQANAARRAKNAAQASALSSRATAMLATDPTESARLAADAVGRDPSTPGAELVLRQALDASHLRQIVSRGRSAVIGAAFSPDGHHIVATSDNGTITVYDSDTGKLVQTTRPVSARSNNFGGPAAFTGNGQAVVFSTTSGTAYVWRWRSGSEATKLQTSKVSVTAAAPTGDLFATGDDNGRIQLWNSKGEQHGTLFGLAMDTHVNALAFTPDGSALATGSDDYLSLWTIRPGLRSAWNQRVGAPVQSVAFSSDGKYVAAADNEEASLWAAAGGRIQPFGDIEHLPGTSVKFSPAGNRLAIVRGNGAEVWNADDRHVVELNGHSDDILDIAFSPDGNQIVTAAADGTARVWEGLNGGTLLQLRGHAGAVYDASFSSDGNRVLTTGADGTVRIWDVAAGSVLARHSSDVRRAAFGPTGKTVVTASRDTSSCFISKLRPHACHHVGDRRAAVTDARISSSGKDILTADSDGTVTVWSTALEPKARLTWPRLRIGSAAFSPDGQLIAVGSGARVYIWRWKANPHEVLPPDTDVLITDRILDMQFGSGRYHGLVLTAHADGTARLWDSGTGQLVRTFSEPGADTTYEAKFSRTGDRVVTASGDGIARVWDTASGRRLHELRSVPPRALTSANFSPDGTRVVAGDTEGNVMIWDVASEELLGSLPWHAGAVNSVEFDPTGDGQILSTGDDGVVRLSTCTTCGPVGALLEAVRRLPK